MLEIITGYGEDLNTAIDLMIDNWEYWDSTDKSSDTHSATKGNCTLSTDNSNYFYIYRNGSQAGDISYSGHVNYAIVKNSKAVLLTWNYGTTTQRYLMATTATDLNGAETFMLGVFLNGNLPGQVLCNDEETYNLPGLPEVSPTLYQLAELVMPSGGAVADGVKRVMFSYSQVQQQTVSLNGETYYIAGKVAMMDV